MVYNLDVQKKKVFIIKKLISASLITSVLLGSGIIAHAQTTYGGITYHDIPGTNGYSTSESQTKTRTNASSDLKITYISVKNKVDTRAFGGVGQGTGPWVRDTNVGTHAIPNPVGKGKATQLKFSTDLLSSGVQLSEKWRSN